LPPGPAAANDPQDVATTPRRHGATPPRPALRAPPATLA
jgi:hypothetical protein